MKLCRLRRFSRFRRLSGRYTPSFERHPTVCASLAALRSPMVLEYRARGVNQVMSKQLSFVVATSLLALAAQRLLLCRSSLSADGLLERRLGSGIGIVSRLRDGTCNAHSPCQTATSKMTCGSGCGDIYWGEWLSNPPDACDPCDGCGNWVGPRCCPPRWWQQLTCGAPGLWGWRCGDGDVLRPRVGL